MRKIIKSLSLVLLIPIMSGCSDFLDQKSPSELDNEIVFNSVSYSEFALNKIYGDLTLDETYSQYIPIIWGANSDCELIDGLGDNAQNTSSERGNMNYNAHPGWTNIARLWKAMYTNIENANTVIEGISNSQILNTTGADKNKMLRFKGEALTLRAMLHFDLIRSFGDIPMKVETTKTDLSNINGKTDRDEIMDKLIVDLQEAITYLPWAGQSGYTTEHVTKGYAHALLANIALTRAGWSIRESAKEGYVTATFSDGTYPTQRCDDNTRKELYELALLHLGEVIKSGTHQLNPSIENHWYLINQRTLDQVYRENIFEIPMGLSKSGELGYTVGVRINGASQRYGEKGNSSGKLRLTAPYFWSFDRKDLRRDITCAPYQLKESNNVLKEEMTGNAPFELYCAKWDIRKMSEEWRSAAINAGNAKLMTGINVVRMRYPQILLMFAEVMNELYGCDSKDVATGLSARDALGKVHSRAFDSSTQSTAQTYISSIPGDKQGFFNAIVDENAWELAGEGFRKFDLIRWNLLSSKIDQFKNDYKAQISEYPEKIYFKYNADYSIDMNSIQWYDVPADVTGYENKTFWGAENTDKTQKQLLTNLPSISSGLNKVVKNRYLLPIASTTISSSKGKLQNSYGYSN